ncbi:integral membrane sensor signal transduction histidine kinase [Alkaliphilus metalliredigens QYMF]|uniref:histidine kinase n=1 Tax=Alkaliphilus metalliredigens (strain QYMF) TaxID=293826 RepID=A6TND3_ALKMQ|nr:ATP-binding protein [Alkaliphilus metalliredigens]ABR47701.1 integral membrane sensor signal transduction histidine kinase [Alkaliphilus metalliredigens QYMF]
MSNKRKFLKVVKEILGLFVLILTEVFKYIKIGLKQLHDIFIEKLRFSLTFKIILVYARKTLSILLLFGLFILGGFILLSGWNAQESMKRDFYLVSDYLTDDMRSAEEKIKRLAELDNLIISIFDENSNGLYTTEGDNNAVVFYGEIEPAEGWGINGNYVLVKEELSIYDEPSGIFNQEEDNVVYAMVLREDAHWNDVPVQIQIKNRMTKEKTRLVLLALVLLGIDIFLLLTVLISGARSSKKIVKPIEVMTKAVENITINEINTRLSVSGSQDELKDLARTFNSMLDRIQQSYEQQNQFVSDASHELRTPISVIQGYADLLVRWGKKDEKILEESLTAIKEESENMKDLVEKLLFLARGDKNTQKVEKKDFYLNELIDDVVKETRMIDGSHQIINLKNEGILMNADPRLIKESLRIFIDNCIKYTPSGGSIKIESILKKNEVEISIEDTGIGISKEDLPNIFNRFYRADKSRTKGIDGTGGTGLGLAIASWIIQRHNGRIKVESQIDVGTKVVINLPRHVHPDL